MAEVLGFITIGFIDSDGTVASTHINFEADATIALNTLMNELDLIATAAIALSEDAVTELKYTFLPVNPGPLTPTADSDSQEGLLIDYNLSGSKFVEELWIPALIDALLVNGKINLANAALVNLTTQLTTQTDVKGTNKFEVLITTLRSAAVSFRKLRREVTENTRSKA